MTEQPRIVGTGQVAPVGSSILPPPDSLNQIVEQQVAPLQAPTGIADALRAAMIREGGTKAEQAQQIPDYSLSLLALHLSAKTTLSGDGLYSWLQLSMPGDAPVAQVRDLVDALRTQCGEFFFKTDIWKQTAIDTQSNDPISMDAYMGIAGIFDRYDIMRSSVRAVTIFAKGISLPLYEDPYLFLLNVPPEHRSLLAGALSLSDKKAFARFDLATKVALPSLANSVRAGLHMKAVMTYAEKTGQTNVMPAWDALQAVGK